MDPANFDPTKYMQAMSGMFQNPQFMQMAEKLGQAIIQVWRGWGLGGWAGSRLHTDGNNSLGCTQMAAAVPAGAIWQLMMQVCMLAGQCMLALHIPACLLGTPLTSSRPPRTLFFSKRLPYARVSVCLAASFLLLLWRRVTPTCSA